MNTIKRKTYWGWFVGYILISIVYNYISTTFFANKVHSYEEFMITTAISVAIYLVFILLPFIFKAVVPRLRDCGKPTALAWLIFVPFIGAIFVIYIGCLKSKDN